MQLCCFIAPDRSGSSNDEHNMLFALRFLSAAQASEVKKSTTALLSGAKLVQKRLEKARKKTKTVEEMSGDPAASSGPAPPPTAAATAPVASADVLKDHIFALTAASLSLCVAAMTGESTSQLEVCARTVTSLARDTAIECHYDDHFRTQRKRCVGQSRGAGPQVPMIYMYHSPYARYPCSL